MDELGRISPDEYTRMEKTPVVVVLDNVRSLHNVGAVFRTADAFGVTAIHLCGITAQPPHREITKTALGASEYIDWKYFPDTLASLAELKSQGYRLLAVEQAQGSVPLSNYKVGGEKIAIILGHEVDGVQQAVLDQVDGCLEIPQAGAKHSLNVSVCAGIVLWDLYNQLVLRQNPLKNYCSVQVQPDLVCASSWFS